MNKIKIDRVTLTLPDKRDWKPIEPAHLDPWLEALRSGRYQQGHGSLKVKHDSEECPYYCCLGLKRELEGCAWVVKPGYSAYTDPLKVDEAAFYVGPLEQIQGPGPYPASCLVQIHWDSNTSTTISHNLANTNDSGITFPQIADIIEAIWGNKYYNTDNIFTTVPTT